MANAMIKHWLPPGQIIRALIVSATLAGLIGAAHAQEQVGVTNKTKNIVTGSFSKRTLKVTDPVYRNEKLTAGFNSFGEFLLNDDSKILVGENSEVTLDEFTVASDGTIETATFSITKGALRFIGGDHVKPNAYRINTPTASIGIRGTKLEVYVRD
jgi:hypothetical protein